MAKKLLSVWLFLIFCMGMAPSEVPKDPLRLGEVAEMFRLPGINVSVNWIECGQFNAFYAPAHKWVVLCTELLSAPPSVVRYIFAHELAHAVIIQLDIPITGSDEVAADELAAIIMSLYGHQEDILEGARFWWKRDQPDIWFDSHPSDRRRAAALSCLAYGSQGKGTAIMSPENFPFGAFTCSPDTWVRTHRTWMRLLGL